MSTVVAFLTEIFKTFGGFLFKIQSPWISILIVLVVSGIAYAAGKAKESTCFFWIFAIILQVCIRLIRHVNKEILMFIGSVAVIVTCVSTVVLISSGIKAIVSKIVTELSKKKKSSTNEAPAQKAKTA